MYFYNHGVVILALRAAFLCCLMLLGGTSIILPGFVLAAQTPDAGQLLREAEPVHQHQKPRSGQVILPPANPESETETSELQVQVNGFEFTGNEYISREQLLSHIPLISSIPGKETNLTELNKVVDAITQYYREQGFPVAMAYLPRQEVINGMVTVAILEGRYDQGQVNGDSRYYDGELQLYMHEALCGQPEGGCADKVVERARIDRAIGVINDLPGIADVTGTFRTGNRLGTTRLLLDVIEEPVLQASVNADNFGNRYTGRNRVAANVLINNPSGLGDQFVVDANTSGKGLRYGSLNYNFPHGYAGWRTGFGFSKMVYELGEPFDVSDAHGEGRVWSLYSSYPLIRSLASTLTVQASFFHKQLKDTVLDSTLKKQDRLFSVGLSGSHLDDFAGGGLTSYSVAISHGNLHYSGDSLPTGVPDNSGSFSKLNYSLTRDQTIAYRGNTQRFSVYGLVTGQAAGDNLDSVEKITLGGPSGVRAYPTGEAIGDSGIIATLEARYSTIVSLAGSRDLIIALFRDQGWLDVNYRTWEGYNGPAKRRLAGYGLSVSLRGNESFYIKATLAARDRSGEPATSDDDSRSRIWIQAGMNF